MYVEIIVALGVGRGLSRHEKQPRGELVRQLEYVEAGRFKAVRAPRPHRAEDTTRPAPPVTQYLVCALPVCGAAGCDLVAAGAPGRGGGGSRGGDTWESPANRADRCVPPTACRANTEAIRCRRSAI